MTPAEKKQLPSSPSALIDAANCMWMWAEKRVYKRKGNCRSEPLDFGILGHRIMEHYNDDCEKNKVAARPDVMEDMVNAHFFSDERGCVPADRYQEMLEMCMRTAYRQELDLNSLVDVEGFLWMDVNGYRFRGKPDVTFVRGNQVVLWDYKTSRAIATENDIKHDFKSRCYVALAMDEENFPQADTVEIVMPFMRYGVAPSHVFIREDAVAVKEEIYQRMEEIEGCIDYKCADGCDWCGLCEFRDVCPSLTHAMMGAGNMVKVVADYEQAQFLVGQKKLLEVALKNTTDALKVFAKHTPVTVNGLCYGPREHRSRTYDPDELYDACKDTEPGAFAFLSADGNAIRAEIKRKRKWIPEIDLTEMGTEVVRTRMELYRVPKPAPEPPGDVCPHCSGKAVVPGLDGENPAPVPCENCGGTGRIKPVSVTPEPKEADDA